MKISNTSLIKDRPDGLVYNSPTIIRKIMMRWRLFPAFAGVLYLTYVLLKVGNYSFAAIIFVFSSIVFFLQFSLVRAIESQEKNLRCFKKIEIPYPAVLAQLEVLKRHRELKWIKTKHKRGRFTKYRTKIGLFSWGEEITILVKDDHILFNSSPRGDRPFSIVGWYHKRNLKKLCGVLMEMKP